MMAVFDEETTRQAIGSWETWRVVVLCVAADRRLLSCYEAFRADSGWGNAKPLVEGIDRAILIARGSSASEEELATLVRECEKVAPDADDHQILMTGPAQDACFATCSLLEYCAGGPLERAVTALRYPTDALDLIIQESLQLATTDPLLEEKILTHPMMQQELERQARDVKEAGGLARAEIEAFLAIRRHEGVLDGS